MNALARQCGEPVLGSDKRHGARIGNGLNSIVVGGGGDGDILEGNGRNDAVFGGLGTTFSATSAPVMATTLCRTSPALA